MTNDVDTLATALYATAGDMLKAIPGCARAVGLMRSVNPILATTALMECGRSRETVKRSGLAGRAGYGYCASRSPSPSP